MQPTERSSDRNAAASSDVTSAYLARHSNVPIPSQLDPQCGSQWTEQPWDAGLAEQMPDAYSLSSGSYDFSHLAEIDDIFSFTGSSLPLFPQPQPEPGFGPIFSQQNLGPSQMIQTTPLNGSSALTSYASSQYLSRLSPEDYEYLCRQGCFNLPPLGTFRKMMCLYYRWVHPNLPVVPEDEFWSLWDGDNFRLGDYSWLLVRSMIFAATSVLYPRSRRVSYR